VGQGFKIAGNDAANVEREHAGTHGNQCRVAALIGGRRSTTSDDHQTVLLAPRYSMPLLVRMRYDGGQMPVEIPKCSSPERYEQYATNVEAHSPEKAQEARREAVRMRARQWGAETDAERECLEAIFAYEWTLFKKHGRRQPASYTRRMVQNRGILAAVEQAVTRSKETAGFRGLQAEGMLEMAFEAVVLRHRDLFSPTAVTCSEERLSRWRTQGENPT
jgi:hypothetical protein